MKMEGRKLADRIVELAGDKKGENITVMDLKKDNYVTDFFVIVSGDSAVHARAIGDHIDDTLSAEGIYPLHRQEDTGSNWILLDYVDVVVHVFENATREFYALERLWGDAKKNMLNRKPVGKRVRKTTKKKFKRNIDGKKAQRTVKKKPAKRRK